MLQFSGMAKVSSLQLFREVISKYKITYGKKIKKLNLERKKKLQQMHKKKLLREKEKTLDG